MKIFIMCFASYHSIELEEFGKSTTIDTAYIYVLQAFTQEMISFVRSSVLYNKI
jgi:hypothetical protein